MDIDGDPSNSLACCFFVDMTNEKKKKTTSCKKIPADAFAAASAGLAASVSAVAAAAAASDNVETGKKLHQLHRLHHRFADGKNLGNVKSASLPSVYSEDERVKNGAGKNSAAIAATTATATANTAWEIPSGKKKKQKGKQRRNTQTITMEGAQVDSSQLYQAVCSYNPILFSHSGRSTEELSLMEGDVVKPLSGVDATGYLYAQVCGNKGLVPAAYLIPLTKAASSPTTVADERKTQEKAESDNLPSDAPSNAHDNALSNRDHHSDGFPVVPIIDGKRQEGCSTKHELPSAGQPHSPSKVFVQRVLSDFSILLGWVMPPMDEFGFSNGVQVKGYRIFVNDVLVEDVPSALQTKILVDSASFPKCHYKDFGSDYICFKVVSTSVGGVDSPPSTCILEVGLGTSKSETGFDVNDSEGRGGEGKAGEMMAALTPGEQPLTESDATGSELETETIPCWKKGPRIIGRRGKLIP